MTTYDKLWETFIQKCKISDIDLPQIPEAIYQTIQGALLSYNNRKRDNITGDDTIEELSRELSTDELLILAHYIRLSILENQLIFFTNTWQPFSADVGLRNFGTQLKTLEKLVENENKKIDSLIANTEEDYL